MSRCSMRMPVPSGPRASSASMLGRLLRAVKLLPMNSKRKDRSASVDRFAMCSSGGRYEAAGGGADFGRNVIAAGKEQLERFLGGDAQRNALGDRHEVEPAG